MDKNNTDKNNLSIDKKEHRNKMIIEGYPIEGLSIAGHETCVIFPSLSLAFDIGKCPQRAISQEYLFISHAHMDHIVCILIPFSSFYVFSCLCVCLCFFIMS